MDWKFSQLTLLHNIKGTYHTELVWGSSTLFLKIGTDMAWDQSWIYQRSQSCPTSVDLSWIGFAEQLPEMAPMILIFSIFLDQEARSWGQKDYIIFTFISFQNVGFRSFDDLNILSPSWIN